MQIPESPVRHDLTSLLVNELPTNQFTKHPLSSMQQNLWEADSSSASQKISCVAWNLHARYCSYERPSPVHILSRISPVHAFSSDLFKTQF
jgi:hypothetical protein